MSEKQPISEGYLEASEPKFRQLHDAIGRYFYTFHDSMDNKAISDMGSEWIEQQLEKHKDEIKNCVEDLSQIMGKETALSEAKNIWDSLMRTYEDDFINRGKTFSLINTDFEQRIGKIF